MSSTDRGPLANTPSTALITKRANNRLGAVCSALYGFWSARNAAISGQTAGQAAVARRDAYSIVLFDNGIRLGPISDMTSTPDELLNAVLQYSAGGGTNFNQALRSAQDVMEQNWSTERFVCATISLF
jgi:hypothetical protein